jgi:hypothetical protein
MAVATGKRGLFKEIEIGTKRPGMRKLVSGIIVTVRSESAYSTVVRSLRKAKVCSIIHDVEYIGASFGILRERKQSIHFADITRTDY